MKEVRGVRVWGDPVTDGGTYPRFPGVFQFAGEIG